MNKTSIEENTQVQLFIELATHMTDLIVAERELDNLHQEWARLDAQEQILQQQLSTFQAIPTF